LRIDNSCASPARGAFSDHGFRELGLIFKVKVKTENRNKVPVQELPNTMRQLAGDIGA
jgi:hypothetical protein